jgi:hypothetical protein
MQCTGKVSTFYYILLCHCPLFCFERLKPRRKLHDIRSLMAPSAPHRHLLRLHSRPKGHTCCGMVDTGIQVGPPFRIQLHGYGYGYGYHLGRVRGHASWPNKHMSRAGCVCCGSDQRRGRFFCKRACTPAERWLDIEEVS